MSMEFVTSREISKHCLRNRVPVLPDAEPIGDLILSGFVSRTMRNKFLFLIYLRCQDFVIAAQTEPNSTHSLKWISVLW